MPDGARMSAGEGVAALGALVVAASMFLPWFELGAGSKGFGQRPAATAWQAFTVIDVLLAALVAAVVVVIAMRATRTASRLPVSVGPLLAGIGLVALLLVLFRFVEAPADVAPEIDADVKRRLGVYVGLAGTLAVTLGGFAIRE